MSDGYRWLTEHASRTINDCLDFIIDYFDFVADAMRDPQNLRKRHSSFLLSQLIKPLDRILQIRPPSQSLQELFYGELVEVSRTDIGKLTC